MGYSRGECLICYLQRYGNNFTDTNMSNVCFECIKKVCDGDLYMGNVIYAYREEFTEVNCECDLECDNFGLETIDICNECHQEMEELWSDEYGLMPSNYKEIECDHCNHNVKHHKDNPGIKRIILCDTCNAIEQLLYSSKYEHKYCKLGWLECQINEIEELNLTVNHFDSPDEYRIERVKCICNHSFDLVCWAEDKISDYQTFVCNHDFETYYQYIIKIKLTFDWQHLHYNASMKLYLPIEIWDLIRCMLIDMNVS